MAGSGRAEVPFARFQAWADAIKGERVTFAEMARVTGATTPTYSRANAQGAVGVRHVVSYARGVGESPLEALRAALPWPFLVEDPEPSTAEWVSQSPHALILGELATRFDLGNQATPFLRMLMAHMTNPDKGGLPGFVQSLRSAGWNTLDSWLGRADLATNATEEHIERAFGHNGA